MSVEKVDHVSERFAHIIVGLVNEVRPHPNADKLRIATVSMGSAAVEIVCGGTNLVEGMKVALALPGSTVIGHDGQRVTLAVNTIRGVESPGMLCGPDELGFGALKKGAHEIWDLGAVTDAKAGTPLAEALGIDDVMFDVEITTNRPDAMGIVGLAREAGAACGAPFAWQPPIFPVAANDIPFTVAIEDASRCLRQMAVVIDGVTVAPSPWWLQARLLLAGLRPINNIVDITNYVMLEYAQPLHAFDYKKLDGAEIRVRQGRAGEKLVALNGKEYDVEGVLVLADAVKPLDIAGIMGGEHTGTTSETTTVVLSASAFDHVALRRTSRALHLQSDAQLLFEKGLSTEAPPFALARAVELIAKIAGGRVASPVCDERVSPYVPIVLTCNPQKIRERIGIDISDVRILEILTQLGFAVDQLHGAWSVIVPWWRDHDIEDAIDLSEEVARIYGYHELPAILPSGVPPTTPEDATLVWERWCKRFFAGAGYDEFFSNSFVSADDLARYGEDAAQSYALLNPLASDLSHMRMSLMPSILRAVESNQGHIASAKFFELSRVYIPHGNDMPEERMQLVLGEYGHDDVEKAFMRTRGVLDVFAARTGLSLTLLRDETDARWHPSRTAKIMHGEVCVGRIGEIAFATQIAFGINRRVMVLALDLETLFSSMHLTHRYVPVSEFPSVVRDLSIILDERATFDDIVRCAKNDIVASAALVDVYRGAGVPEGKKSMTVSFTMQVERTLTSEEADTALAVISEKLVSELSGILRS